MAGRALVVLGLLTAFTAVASEAKHPRLVSAAAKCSTCHSDLFENRSTVHPATEDCTNCHDVQIDRETGTTITLLESQPTLCVACHSEKEDLDVLASPHYPATEGCTTCHNPHATNQPTLLNAEPPGLCFDCHDSKSVDDGHPIAVKRTDCRLCHAPHGSDVPGMLRGSTVHPPFEDGSCDACHKTGFGGRIRLRSEGAGLCYACHSDLEDRFATGPVHTAVRQGLCISCHEPHVAEQAKMLRSRDPQLCWNCHGEIAAIASGPGGHPPAAESCENCHDPHASGEEKQLQELPPALCLNCHDEGDESLRRKHLGADLSSINCVSCHNPHGSSGANLLVEGSVHPPFEDGCENCHEDSAFNRFAEGGGSDLCVACHSDVPEAAAAAPVPHPALEMADCTDCHTPHVSAQQRLLKRPRGEICRDCHSDKVAEASQLIHGVIDLVGCQACHAVHGGENPRLLKTTGNDLCFGCHLQGLVQRSSDGSLELPGGVHLDADQASSIQAIDLNSTRDRNHPLPNHPVAGKVSGKGATEVSPKLIGLDMSCLSCHNPHLGQSQSLFVNEIESPSQLCLTCHPK